MQPSEGLVEREEWRPIPGFEGRYEASELGRIRSVPRRRTRGGIKTQFLRAGYWSVKLGINETHLVHRLVLTACGDDGYWFIECYDVHVHRNDEAEAIAAWNTRPASAPEQTYAEWQQRRGRLADLRDEVQGILADHYEIRMQPKFAHSDVHRGATGRIFAAISNRDLPEEPASAEGLVEVTDAMIDRALHARVPGGAEVWVWLPQKDAWTPHETARDVMRAALTAALSASAPEGVAEAVYNECLTHAEATVVLGERSKGYQQAWLDAARILPERLSARKE